MTGTGKYILDEHGEPVPCEDVVTWARWIEVHQDDRIVARTTLSDRTMVSTVFLGLDYNFTREWSGPPILYETMVFQNWDRPPDEGGGETLDQRRYPTRDEALRGHLALVALWEGQLGDTATKLGELATDGRSDVGAALTDGKSGLAP